MFPGGLPSRWSGMGAKGATLVSAMTDAEAPRSLWLKFVKGSSWWGHSGVEITEDGKGLKDGAALILTWYETLVPDNGCWLRTLSTNNNRVTTRQQKKFVLKGV